MGWLSRFNNSFNNKQISTLFFRYGQQNIEHTGWEAPIECFMASPAALLTRAKLGNPSSSFTLVLYFSSLYQCCKQIHTEKITSYSQKTSNKIQKQEKRKRKRTYLKRIGWIRRSKNDFAVTDSERVIRAVWSLNSRLLFNYLYWLLLRVDY